MVSRLPNRPYEWKAICHRSRSLRKDKADSRRFSAYGDRLETLKMKLATADGIAALSSPPG